MTRIALFALSLFIVYARGLLAIAGVRRRPIRRGRSASSCPIRPAARPTSSRARSGRSSPSRSGQPVVVENKPGANGNVGADFVAKSPPDGYTLLLADIGALAISPSVYPTLAVRSRRRTSRR